MCNFKSNNFIGKGVQTYTGAAGHRELENYVIGLPPIEEQKRIDKKIMTVLETIKDIEKNMITVK
ncbi:hypothetical protein RJD24_08885 [Bacillaceae bacterium IKA-2]|nr:hypothetical protein RJD24_08885 [Bacillaceae bacterium IKA-2]